MDDSILTTRISANMREFLMRNNGPMSTQLKRDLANYWQLLRMVDEGMGDQLLAKCIKILE